METLETALLTICYDIQMISLAFFFLSVSVCNPHYLLRSNI